MKNYQNLGSSQKVLSQQGRLSQLFFSSMLLALLFILSIAITPAFAQENADAAGTNKIFLPVVQSQSQEQVAAPDERALTGSLVLNSASVTSGNVDPNPGNNTDGNCMPLGTGGQPTNSVVFNKASAQSSTIDPNPANNVAVNCLSKPASATASIGDKVWIDSNNNGVQDINEAPLANVTVTLLSGCTGNTVLGTRTTSSTGNYTFAGLAAGQYRIQMTLPTGYQFTAVNQGTDDGIDSDINPTTGTSDCITLAAGQADPNLDAGTVPSSAPTATPTSTPASTTPGSVGNQVWEDTNGNGIQDFGEPYVQGVTVELLSGCTSTTVLATQTTDANGYYNFTNVAAGQYRIRFTIPKAYQFTLKNQGTRTTHDSNANPDGLTDCITVVSGVADGSVDAGVIAKTAATPTNTPVPPTNTPVPPTATPTNTPTGNTGTPTPTSELGSIGDQVWNDLNGDGNDDGTEPYVQNVVVDLLDGCTGTAVLASQVTDSNGYYNFVGLPAGLYRVRFSLPAGYQFTLKEQGNGPETDSNANADGITDCITLGIGQVNTTIDAGIKIPVNGTGSIGNLVFDDLNRNGLQDSGEVGIDGVTVELYNCSNVFISRKVTTNGGSYTFDNLNSGCYRVRVLQPAGFAISPLDVGSDDTIDSDVSTLNGISANINLGVGVNLTTVDAGLYQLIDPKMTSSVGNFIFDDLNKNGIQDNGEPGMGDVTVKLLDCNGNMLLQKQSASDGYYYFNGLAAGCYKVGFVLPAGYTFSPKNVGNALLDSNPDPATGVSDAVQLATNQGDNSVDAGMIAQTNSGTIVGTSWYDADNNGIQDASEVPFAAVIVKLLDGCEGTTVLRTLVSDVNGNYSFRGLLPGSYRIQAVEVVGYPFSPMDAGTNDAIDSDINSITGISDCITVTAGSTTDIDLGIDPFIGRSLAVNLSSRTYLPLVTR